jgi:hypothetical protein
MDIVRHGETSERRTLGYYIMIGQRNVRRARDERKKSDGNMSNQVVDSLITIHYVFTMGVL